MLSARRFCETKPRLSILIYVDESKIRADLPSCTWFVHIAVECGRQQELDEDVRFFVHLSFPEPCSASNSVGIA